MSRMLFVNLPVSDLTASIAFFSGLGFTFDPAFTDQNATCMVISEQACVMLLRRDFFESFHRRGTARPGDPLEVLTAVSAASREDVDDLCDRARRRRAPRTTRASCTAGASWTSTGTSGK